MGYPKKNLCMRCMNGYCIDGRCTVCGLPEIHTQMIPMALPMGYLLRQQYMIGSVLGKGGFGITYVAWDIKNNRRIAIKELFPTGIAERSEDGHTIRILPEKETHFKTMLTSFQKEVHILIQLQNHKNILSLYHVFEENKTAYYVMEYLDGQDLGKLLKRMGPMTWSQLEPIIKNMMDALEQLHKTGLIHRDVSPDNVFITSNGEHRLIDLGSTRTYRDNSNLTAYVKLNFAPNEQFLPNGTQGPWTDIYALCATCYYALTGKLPAIAPQRSISDTLIPLRQICPQLPRPVLNALESGLKVNWQERCQNISSLRNMMFPKQEAIHAGMPRLMCISGLNKGYTCQLSPGKLIQIGRSAECEIRYPAETSGISRKQCSFVMQNDGHVLVRDDGSSYGTFLIRKDKQFKLVPSQWYYADNGWITFGKNEQYQVTTQVRR